MTDLRDCLIITPTRQRKDNAQRLIDSVAATATAQTDLILAVDDDDAHSYTGLRAGRARVLVGPRQTCPAWTNQIARDYGGGYRALASLGDDHVPETYGWDSLLLGAIDAMGGTGIAYGDDCLQHEKLPTAPVISSDIVVALGWLFLPGLTHFYCDDVWKALAEPDLLAYVPEVIIRHLHFSVGTAPRDGTYAEAEPSMGADAAAYGAWYHDPAGRLAAREKVRRLRSG